MRAVHRRRRAAPDALVRPLRTGLVIIWFGDEEASAAEMAERLVLTLEV